MHLHLDVDAHIQVDMSIEAHVDVNLDTGICSCRDTCFSVDDEIWGY